MDRCKSTMAQYRIKIEEKKKKRMVGWMVLPFADMRSTGPSLRWGNHEFMLGQVGSGASRDAHYGYQVGSTEAEGKYSHVTFPTDMRWSNTSCSHKRAPRLCLHSRSGCSPRGASKAVAVSNSGPRLSGALRSWQKRKERVRNTPPDAVAGSDAPRPAGHRPPQGRRARDCGCAAASA